MQKILIHPPLKMLDSKISRNFENHTREASYVRVDANITGETICEGIKAFLGYKLRIIHDDLAVHHDIRSSSQTLAACLRIPSLRDELFRERENQRHWKKRRNTSYRPAGQGGAKGTL